MSILDESTLTIGEAAPIARTSFCSLWRWILRGVPGPDGRRVRLEAVRCGGKWLASREALQRFTEAITPRFDVKRPQRHGRRCNGDARARRRRRDWPRRGYDAPANRCEIAPDTVRRCLLESIRRCDLLCSLLRLAVRKAAYLDT
jgi:hypothetical protein